MPSMTDHSKEDEAWDVNNDPKRGDEEPNVDVDVDEHPNPDAVEAVRYNDPANVDEVQRDQDEDTFFNYRDKSTLLQRTLNY
jgi:hypothetical protein